VPARRGRPSDAPLLGWTEELPARRVAGQLEALYRQALALLAARLREAGRAEKALERAWQALRVGELIPPDDAERLALEVLEAAAALRDAARLRAEYAALERHLHRRGLELTEHVQRQHEQLLRVVTAALAEQGTQSSKTRGEPVERTFERR
jgi:hypothetical protein